jgi:hypothetical protein
MWENPEMLPIQSFAKSAAAIALGLASLGAFGASALADDSQLYGVKSIDVKLSGAVPEVVVRNVAANHSLGALQLAVQGTHVAVGVSGHVDCTGIQIENWTYREGHFLSGGAFGIGRTSLLMAQALANSSDIDRTSAMGAKTFQLPVASLANPQIAIDPVAAILAEAEKAPSKIAWLRQDQVVTVKVPLRWEADCAYYTRNKITKQTIKEAAQPSYLTRDVDLKIVYKGDPQLFEVNAQVSQGGGLPGQLQVGDQPFKITSMTFQPSMPHHVGACPATKKVRIYYQGQGKGEIRIRINAGNTPMLESPVIAFDSKNGQQHYDFDLETPKAYVNNINNTVQHNLRVYVRGKGATEQVWPAHYQLMDQAVWKTRCTPVVNPVLGGGGAGGKVGGFQNGGANQTPTPGLRLRQPQPVDPATPVIRRVQ